MRTQNFPTPLTSLLAAVGFALATLSALGQAPVIISLSQNGQLVCTNLQPGSTASVEWALSPTGPWTNTWAGLDAVTVDSNGMIRVGVPMLYRVRGTPTPPGMALIPAGSFTMGDSLDGDSRALPLHTVAVSAFYMDKYEVTKVLWDDVYHWATNHGYSFEYGAFGKATNHPAFHMTWYEAVKWCNARSEKENRIPAYYTDAGQANVYRSGQTNVQNDWVKWDRGYRLPTEAEWEKAARGGASGQRFPWGNTISWEQANYTASPFSAGGYPYDVNPRPGYHPTFYDGVYPSTSPVGYFAPNGYGLYDMAGNVLEWCWDLLGLYSSDAQTDPRGPAVLSFRVLRGGGWITSAPSCRASNRDRDMPTLRDTVGFRSVLPPGQ